MNLFFVAVNYNNSKISIDFIKSILNLNCFNTHNIEIIIIDNKSKEDEIILLESFIANLKTSYVTLIKSHENIGYFKALNIGLNYIKDFNKDFVLIGNNDLKFDFDFLIKLENLTINNKIFAIAPNIIKPDGTHQNPHIISKFSILHNIYRRIYFTNYYISILCQIIYNIIKPYLNPQNRVGHNINQNIFSGYGACYILTKNFFNNFTNLDAPVFLMGEELIFSNQIFSKNGLIYYDSTLIVYHIDHSSIGRITSKIIYQYSKDSYIYYRNNLNHIK